MCVWVRLVCSCVWVAGPSATIPELLCAGTPLAARAKEREGERARERVKSESESERERERH